MQYLDQLHRRYRASLGHMGMISVIIGLLTASPALLALFEPVAWSDSHSFIVPGLITSGGLPFVLGGRLSPLDAVFEAMSGWTTTGLIMVDVEAVQPRPARDTSCRTSSGRPASCCGST